MLRRVETSGFINAPGDLGVWQGSRVMRTTDVLAMYQGESSPFLTPLAVTYSMIKTTERISGKGSEGV